ncbi:hypothetical protein VaNZ11_006460, partial [Volvox africanus]
MPFPLTFGWVCVSSSRLLIRLKAMAMMKLAKMTLFEDRASTSAAAVSLERIEARSADSEASRQGGTGALSGGAEGASLAAMTSCGLVPPVPLRVLDLACGSGEATAAIMDWNLRHPVIGRLSVISAAAAMAAPVNKAGTAAASTIGAHTKSADNPKKMKERRKQQQQQQQQQQQSHGLMKHCRHRGATVGLLAAPVL